MVETRNPKRLEGKSVVLIGAARGIGQVTAEIMAAEGARLVLGDLNVDGVIKVAAGIRAAGGQALALGVDISDEGQVEHLVGTAVKEYGRVDVLHQNAAILDVAHLANDLDVVRTPHAIWQKTFDVNFFGTVACCRRVIPVMLEGGGGSIVLTGTMAATAGYPALNAYSASKAALIKLTRDIATGYGRRRIRCNMVAPGLILTELGKQAQGEEGIRTMSRVMATPYPGEPADIAYAAVFFASDESKYITGHVLPVDGGAFMHAPEVDFEPGESASGSRPLTQVRSD